MPDTWTWDEDAVTAAADLAARAGARSFEIGYLHDDVPINEAGWYAHAQYRGHRITAEDMPTPDAAATNLAVQLLAGAKCRCGRLVTLSDDGGVAYPDGQLADGTTWSRDDIQRAGRCRWNRQGARWEPGCDAPPLPARRGQGAY